MKIFLQEFATGGGLAEHSLSPDLLLEGFGMLRKLIENFTKQDFNISTSLDARLDFLSDFLKADKIVTINKEKDFLLKSFKEVQNSDYFLVIAPVTDNILRNLVAEYSKSNATSLNCSKPIIELISKKSNIYRICEKKKLNYPKTIIITNDQEFEDISTNRISKFCSIQELLKESNLLFPLIGKPVSGAACEKLSLIQNKNELTKYYKKMRKKRILIQQFIEGEHLSLTLLVKNRLFQILSINQQILQLNFNNSKYIGGIINLEHPLKDEIIDFITKVLVEIPGMNGLIGIDIVLNNQNEKPIIYLIEINPRATTPICGLINNNSKPIDFDLNNTKKKKDDFLNSKKVGFISKYHFSTEKTLAKILYKKIVNEHSIITPPLNFNQKEYSILAIGYGKNSTEAEDEYQKSVKYLLKKIS